MTRRWLIRCLCLLPLTFCALGWVWSEWHGEAVCYGYLDRHWVKCGASFGRVWLDWGQDGPARFHPGGLSYESWSPEPIFDGPFGGEMAWLGFRFGHLEVRSYIWRRVTVPYWFPLLLSALLPLLAWRTTRPRPHPQGFPVELATRKEPS